MAARFVHLNVHSEFSIQDGLPSMKQLVAETVQCNMPAVAVTDRCNLFGAIKFYNAAHKSGVKPLIGTTVAVSHQKKISVLTLLCMNNEGYEHLKQLISKAYLAGQEFDGKPRVLKEWVVEHAEGLIVLSGAGYGDVGQALLADDQPAAMRCATEWASIFKDRYYLELQRIGKPNEAAYVRGAIALAKNLDLPVVATNAVCFLSASDFEAHEARTCIQLGCVLNDKARPRHYTQQQYFRSEDEMIALFSDIPEAIDNTIAIAKRCSLTLQLGEPKLPNFPVPQGVTLNQHLENESRQGLEALWKIIGEQVDTPYSDYEDRLKLELDVINTMGFPGYFLVVADFISWAKKNGVPVGPGRGSGAGSLVAYALGITLLDPIEHGLLFERFLNPERVSMPDFDIDFCMDGRDRVIDYVAQRYGHNAVSQIITFGTMAAKAVIRDVGRVLGLSYGFVDRLAKLIPFEIGMTLDKALEQEDQLRELYQNEEEVAALINLAKKLEGRTRNAGKHAGGVVISPTVLTDFSAMYCEPGASNHAVTQYDKDDVEAAGLVKFDFLGLRTLTIIDWALGMSNERCRKEGLPLIDIDNIPLDDDKTFDLLKSCETTAVFQLESRGMKDLIRRLQPDSFEEITALVALFRPGPLQSGMVDDFIDRKHGRAVVTYPHPDIAPILEPTYGVILYQEQVMQIAQVLAGYSLGGADILRRAMGKKKPEEMAKQREIFTQGSVDRGVDEEVATSIFDLMEKFAGYGFNKSHSAAYALLAYQTAYLKAHFPAEFMAAVLSSDMDNTDKVVGFIEECRAMKLEVIPPDINASAYQFYVNDEGAIHYGLGAIKGVGQAAAEDIAQECKDHGKYVSLFGFCCRLDHHKVGRRALEPLIRSGAMDGFGVARSQLFASVDKALKLAAQQLATVSSGQEDLFAMDEPTSAVSIEVDYVEAEDWDQLTILSGEKEALGLYLSGHPMQSYVTELKQLTSYTISELKRAVGKEVSVAGMLLAVRTILTRKGKRMAILQIEDQTGKTEVTIFSKLYEEVIRQLEKNQIYIVKAKVESDDFSGGVRLVAESLCHLDYYRQQAAKSIILSISSEAEVNDVLTVLPRIIKGHQPGNCCINLAYKGATAKAMLQLGEAWSVNLSVELLEKLKMHFEQDRFRVIF